MAMLLFTLATLPSDRAYTKSIVTHTYHVLDTTPCSCSKSTCPSTDTRCPSASFNPSFTVRKKSTRTCASRGWLRPEYLQYVYCGTTEKLEITFYSILKSEFTKLYQILFSWGCPFSTVLVFNVNMFNYQLADPTYLHRPICVVKIPIVPGEISG